MARNCHFIIPLFSLILFSGCKHKKVSLSGDEPVKSSDFVAAFQPVKLPFIVTDSMVNKRSNDSTLISYKVFTQFVPDSVLAKNFGKNARPHIYPMGKAEREKKEYYLVAKAVTKEKRIAYVLCFDNKDKFIAGMPLLHPDQLSSTEQTSSIDKSFTLSKAIRRKNPDGTISDGKNVYLLNADTRSFMLIMTDALDAKPEEMINPIDTMARKNKFSADYVRNKTNIVSVRDAHRPGRILFFVHIEDAKSECTGEIKGEASFVSANKAIYRSSGDPCVLELAFSPSSVIIRELEGCGSHRGLHCVFEGNFIKKKVIKKKQAKKKKPIHQ
jgi:hypothetical protein